MSQIEQGQHIPHDGPPQKETALERILKTEWPKDFKPSSFDRHVDLVKAVRDLKDEFEQGNPNTYTQIEF